VGRKATQNDFVSEAIFQDLERFVSAEAVAYQHSRFTICLVTGLRMKYFDEPLQAYLGVSVTRVGECVVLPRRGKSRPISSVSGSRPNHYGLQMPAISAYAFDCRHHLSLDSCTAVIPPVILPHENLDGPEL
jgi:hypothetical protein